MKLLLVGNYAPLQQTSMLRFADLLRDSAEAAGLQVRLLQPTPRLGRLAGGGAGKWLGYLDRFGAFLPQLRAAARWADVVHVCDHGNAVYVPALADRPHVVTCHDLFGAQVARGEIPGEGTGLPGRLLAEAMLGGLARARHVACVSGATRDELRRLVPQLPAARVSVVGNALNYPFSQMAQDEVRTRLSALGLPGRPYLLHIGGNQWYKNRRFVLELYAKLRTRTGFEDLDLVMAGKPMPPALRAFVEAQGLGERVHSPTGVSSADLNALYCGAEALLFPSLAEGFGWPVCEAQACACPVFASDRAPLTEVGGEAAVYFAPDDLDAAAETVATAWARRDGMAAAGLRRAATFSPAHMMEGYLACYRRVLGGGRDA